MIKNGYLFDIQALTIAAAAPATVVTSIVPVSVWVAAAVAAAAIIPVKRGGAITAVSSCRRSCSEKTAAA